MNMLPELSLTEVILEAGQVDLGVSFADVSAQLRTPSEKMEQINGQARALRTFINNSSSHDQLRAIEAMAGSISTLRQYIGLSKVTPVAQLVTHELDAGLDKIILLCMHRSVMMSLRTSLRGYCPVTLFCGTAPAKRKRNLDRFLQKDKYRILISHIQAVGVGINGLQQVCDEALVVEGSLVASDTAQAIMRLHCRGQDNAVNIRFISINGIDRHLQMLLCRNVKSIIEKPLL